MNEPSTSSSPNHIISFNSHAEIQKMILTKGNFAKACMRKWRRIGRRALPSILSSGESCCKWSMRPSSLPDEEIAPSDVPKGHLVVYVGDCNKRFVIKIALLKNPLFQALLDQARDIYEFNAGSKLHIPCDENIFLGVIQCAKSPPDRRRLITCL